MKPHRREFLTTLTAAATSATLAYKTSYRNLP